MDPVALRRERAREGDCPPDQVVVAILDADPVAVVQRDLAPLNGVPAAVDAEARAWELLDPEAVEGDAARSVSPVDEDARKLKRIAGPKGGAIPRLESDQAPALVDDDQVRCGERLVEQNGSRREPRRKHYLVDTGIPLGFLERLT